MPHVDISYSIESDAKNWIRIAKKQKTSFGLSEEKERGFLEQFPDVDWSISSEELQPIVAKKLEGDVELQKSIARTVEELKERWSTVEADYFRILGTVTERPIYSETFSAQLTTASLCPVDERHSWFMVNARRNVDQQVTGIAHEIFHLQFLHYYKQECLKAGLSESQIDALKESLTVLLNEPEFSSVITSPDRGYSMHEAVRTELSASWKKTRQFVAFLPLAIKVVVSTAK